MIRNVKNARKHFFLDKFVITSSCEKLLRDHEASVKSWTWM